MLTVSRLILGTSIACFAMGASAQILNDGTFIGFKVGASRIQSPNQNLTNSTNAKHERDKFAWGLNLGYNYFTSNNAFVSVELGYDVYGNAEYKGTVSSTNYDVKIEQYDLDMLFGLGYMLNAGPSAAFKFGAARVQQKTSGAGGSADFQEGNTSRTHYRPKIEIDVGWAINNNLNVALTASHLFGASDRNFPTSNKRTYTNNAVYLGFQYTIPQ